MGASKTICYCAGRKCKKSVGEKSEEMFDQQHWAEIRDNLERYLQEEVCVPNVDKTIQVPQFIIDTLNQYTRVMSRIRSMETSDVDQCLDTLSDAQQTLNQLNYVCQQVNTTVDEQQVIVALGPLTSSELDFSYVSGNVDPFIDVSVVMTKSLHRAFFELMESRRIRDNTYIFHHLALVFDIISELYRLTNEAFLHITSENFLGEDHPHLLMVEKRGQESN